MRFNWQNSFLVTVGFLAGLAYPTNGGHGWALLILLSALGVNVIYFESKK